VKNVCVVLQIAMSDALAAAMPASAVNQAQTPLLRSVVDLSYSLLHGLLYDRSK